MLAPCAPSKLGTPSRRLVSQRMYKIKPWRVLLSLELVAVRGAQLTIGLRWLVNTFLVLVSVYPGVIAANSALVRNTPTDILWIDGLLTLFCKGKCGVADQSEYCCRMNHSTPICPLDLEECSWKRATTIPYLKTILNPTILGHRALATRV